MKSAIPRHLLPSPDEIIFAELRAFPGVTNSMLNVRLRNRMLWKEFQYRVPQLIRDGEIVERFKRIDGLQKPVRVLFVKDDDSIVSSPGVQGHTEDAELLG